MLDEETKLNYKRLFAVIALGIIGTFSLYKLSCSREEKPEKESYSTLVNRVFEELPNNKEFIDSFIQKSIDTAYEQKTILHPDTYRRMFKLVRNKMAEIPELSDYLPKEAINYQLEKNKPDIRDYLLRGEK